MKNDGQTIETDRDSGVLSNPLSFLRSGYFGWNHAGLYSRGGYSGYWSNRSNSTNYSDSLILDSARLNPQNTYESHGGGFAARCNKSFTTLINTSYSMKDYNQTSEDNQDSGLLSNPLSFLRNGYFYWVNAGLANRGGYGYYWSLRSTTKISSNSLLFYGTRLYLQYGSNRGMGYAVRCIQILHHSH